MTATKPERIVFDDDSIFNQDLTDKLLSEYKNATWALKVNDELIFELTPAMRQEILDNYACWFVDWVLDGMKRELTHDYDPPWDHSGHIVTKQMGEGALLFWYLTLGEWMEEELTGNQTATFTSGYGLSADNFEREIHDSIERDMWESLQAEIPEEEELEFEEILADSDTFVWGVEAFVDPLMKLLGQMNTDEVWKKFKDPVIFSRKLANEAARRRQEFREMLREKSKELKEASLSQITKAKIERPQWKEENLGELLEQILKEAEIEYVVAVVEVGLPGHFSNSVAAEIRAIGKSVLESRKDEAGEVYFLGLVKDLKEHLMMLGKDNPVIKLCIEGTQAEFQGYLDRAHHLYKQAWKTAQSDYDACIAAHYLARGQEDLHKKLHWSQVALEKAIAVGDHRVAAFFPSLYLCLGESYELLGNKNEAQRYYALAAELGVVHGEPGKRKRPDSITDHHP